MVEFDIAYESNVEFGQVVQKCDCADAIVMVMVEPSYERDATPPPIPFSATMRRMASDNALEDSGGEVEIWQTQKHSINTYNLDVRPRIGTSHHDYSTSADARLGESGTMAAITNDFPAWPQHISASASRFAVPEILLLSIVVMETTHGWYDALLQPAGLNETIRPMNINVAYWPALFSAEDMHDPAKNFDAGAFMLKRIAERLAPNDRTTRKIATLYNDINAKSVTDYGARVEYFTKTLRPDWRPVPPHPEKHR